MYGPLARWVKLRVAHAPAMPGTFSPPPSVRERNMHHGTCVTHVPWCMPGSLTSGFFWSQWRGKRSRHSRRMRNPHLYVTGKRPMGEYTSPRNAPVIYVPEVMNHYISGPQSISILCAIYDNLYIIQCSWYRHRILLADFKDITWMAKWDRTRRIRAGIEPKLQRPWFAANSCVSPQRWLVRIRATYNYEILTVINETLSTLS